MKILPTINSIFNPKKYSKNALVTRKNETLEFCDNDFFVNIKGYGKNKDWVSVIKKTANDTVKFIMENKTSDEVLQKIAKGVKIANGFCRDINLRRHTGILRTERKGYGKIGSWHGIELCTPIDSKYKSYTKKLSKTAKKPLKPEYSDIDVATVESGNWVDYNLRINHPGDDKVNNALDRIGGKFFNLKKDYILNPQNVKKENLPDINSNIAEIRWIMAHSMPWERGSDSISNVFMRTLYKSMGIKSYPLKKGVSLDLEAFCTPLEKYKADFVTYFEKSPEIV